MLSTISISILLHFSEFSTSFSICSIIDASFNSVACEKIMQRYVFKAFTMAHYAPYIYWTLNGKQWTMKGQKIVANLASNSVENEKKKYPKSSPLSYGS